MQGFSAYFRDKITTIRMSINQTRSDNKIFGCIVAHCIRTETLHLPPRSHPKHI
uniref:Uncharacterized protein n=1 Tax=Anguilla anguilla TaxID=7936 RepID=A0A0E9RF82_ANGAN